MKTNTTTIPANLKNTVIIAVIAVFSVITLNKANADNNFWHSKGYTATHAKHKGKQCLRVAHFGNEEMVKKPSSKK